MRALQAAGVSSFLIEVDNVPGELLNLADNIRQSGAKVEFVRSVSDLRPDAACPAVVRRGIDEERDVPVLGHDAQRFE